jgi:hypothetical protein
MAKSPYTPDPIFLAFLERVSIATNMTQVMTAANIAREEMLGVPYEPYPAVRA